MVKMLLKHGINTKSGEAESYESSVMEAAQGDAIKS
jgi:hypothetical protein